MKKLALIATLILFAPGLCLADYILTPSSAPLRLSNGQMVHCYPDEGVLPPPPPAAVESSPMLIRYSCMCYNTGRTDNPAPQRIVFDTQNDNTAILDGQAQCSTLNYGKPDFGFSPVQNCHPID